MLFLLHVLLNTTLFFRLTIGIFADEKTEPVASAVPTPSVQSIDTQWPSIRGPQWNGISQEGGLADSWPKEGPPVLWTRELGQGYSAFVAWDDRLATQYQTLRGQFVACLEADTGRTIWEHRYDWPYDPAGVYPGPRATPTYHDGCVYFASPAGLIGCLNADSGKLIWSLELSTRFKGELTGFGYACSPTLIDGLLILPVGCPGASMVAFDAKSGAVRWQAGQQAASYAPAFPIHLRGRALVLGYMENFLVCHDRSTGEVLWEHKLSAGYDEHSSWPLYREPHLWISSPFRAGAELLELSDDPSAPVRSLGKQSLISNDIFPSVLLDGAVYGFDVLEPQAKIHRSTRGVFRCIDFMTGEEHWAVGDGRPIRGSQNTPVPSTALKKENSSEGSYGHDRFIGHATVIAADGKLILFNDLGELILARATAERFDELGRISVLSGEICWTQPALSRGRLFVRNQSRAACLFLGKPEFLEADLQRQATTTAAIPQSEYFDWAAIILGVEPEYAFDIPSPQWLIKWYKVSLIGIIGGGFAVLLAAMTIRPVRRLSAETRETCCWIVIFFAGALGTTFLSPLMNDFIFTWPVCIFASYQCLMDRLAMHRRELSSRDRWRSRLACIVFLATCLLYFLVCRRLSLVFEWVFLGGFAAAIPLSLAGRFFFAKKSWHWLWKVVCIAASFTAFYWSSVAFLHVRVR